jgi:hypothetical protein
VLKKNINHPNFFCQDKNILGLHFCFPTLQKYFQQLQKKIMTTQKKNYDMTKIFTTSEK